jgi:hypothetical protein
MTNDASRRKLRRSAFVVEYATDRKRYSATHVLTDELVREDRMASCAFLARLKEESKSRTSRSKDRCRRS